MYMFASRKNGVLIDYVIFNIYLFVVVFNIHIIVFVLLGDILLDIV